MSLSALDRSGPQNLGREAARIATPPSGTWLPRFRRRHDITVACLLVVLIAAYSCGALSLVDGGALLLVGGALIGIPHGSSDFVVAHRAMAPRFGRSWLLRFLALYLAIMGAVMVSWIMAPAPTFILFLGISGLHFGADEGGETTASSLFLARAATPILPIFLCHPAGVAGVVGLMSHTPAATVSALLIALRPAGLLLYAALLGWTVLKLAIEAFHGTGTPKALHDLAEVLLLAAAAVVLPPLVTFAVYFCLIHALRHMAQLAHDMHPHHKAAAARLAAAIVLPSALACLLALGSAWAPVAGVIRTEPLLALALQITAALTVPHVLLEWWAARPSRRAVTFNSADRIPPARSCGGCRRIRR